jgi:hypothetical protein
MAKMNPIMLATEMQSFLKVSPDTLAKAKASKLTASNCPALRGLINDWSNGVYDEDPEYVISELETILNNE